MHPRSSMVKFCLDRATECRCGAEHAADAARRQFWLEIEGQWFFLARSYDNQRRDNADFPLRVAIAGRSVPMRGNSNSKNIHASGLTALIPKMPEYRRRNWPPRTDLQQALPSAPGS